VTTSENDLAGHVVLGRYRVLRRLALGGMGAVYLARTEGARGFSKPVVIKRILPVWGGDEEIVSLFAREARILSQLQDPGIVSVLDFGPIEDGTLVMVLDYVHGHHLAHWLAYLRAVQGTMPVDMAIHIMLRVLSALQYAHTFVKSDGKPLAVVHRDVSPANILIDVNGHVKLVDFGIARAEGDDGYKTEAPQLRGKFGYLAPELFMGSPASPQSDVYAAAVVLYELLTGDNPFRGRELVDSYHKALHVEAPAISSKRIDVSDELSHIIVDRALAKDPADRYLSAAEFADALRPERDAPDEVCQARLRSAVQLAFAGPLAETLRVPPLSAIDDAMREAASDKPAPAPALAEPAVGTRPVGSIPPAKPSAERAGAPHENVPSSTESPAPAQTSVSSTSKPGPLRWVAVAGLVLSGSLVTVSVLRSLDQLDSKDRVIVIEREPSAASTPGAAEPGGPADTAGRAADAPRAVPAVDEREPAHTPLARTVTSGLDAAERVPAAASSVGTAEALAVNPEPALLTREFARQQARVQECFGTHARSDVTRGTFTELTITFRVEASGSVEQADLQPVQAASSALGKCLVRVARGTTFPRLTHAVTFQIPIHARVTGS